MDFLDKILDTGLGIYTAKNDASTARTQAQIAASQSAAASAQSNAMTKWLLIGGAVVAVIAIVFAFRKS